MTTLTATHYVPRRCLGRFFGAHFCYVLPPARSSGSAVRQPHISRPSCVVRMLICDVSSRVLRSRGEALALDRIFEHRPLTVF